MMTIVIVMMILMVNIYVIYYKSDQVCHENSGNHDDGDNDNDNNHDGHCNRNDDLDGQLLCDLLHVRSGLSCAINKMRFVIYF